MAAFKEWWRQRSRTAKIALIVGGVFISLAILGALIPADDTGDGAGGDSAEVSEPEAASPPSNRADDDNEPHVGSDGSVIVDTLEWRVVSVRSGKAIGNEFTRETADGVFVVVALEVTNGKDESVTLSSDQVSYEVSGKKYETDSDGTVALSIQDDEETFLLKDLGPDVTTEGSVVFDVPQATLQQQPEVCFGELGFGSTRGCIVLPI
ncbi:MAG TPA: DUF4352 domain-containing protein [Gaiellaceae bacterium]|jgi:hypothetical protein